MNEEERAEWLARAIDDLLKADRQSEAASEPPAGWEAEELKALMRVARARLDTARDTANAGLQYEGAIWQQVVSRLNGNLGKERPKLEDELDWLTNARGHAGTRDSETARRSRKVESASWRDAEVEELREIALLRRQMAEEAASLAEEHRDAVWQRLQSRIQGRPHKAGFFSFMHRFLPDAARKAAALDRSHVQPSDDETLDGLIRIARARMELSGPATSEFKTRQDQLWALILPDLSNQVLATAARGEPSRPRSRLWPRKLSYNFAAAAALGSLIVAAVGPLPATGLANHPAVEFVQFLGDHLGVTETGSPPAVRDSAEIVRGVDAGAAEATSLLGFSVTEPTAMPEGFQRTSSQFFPLALTAAEGGMFVLTYESDGASVVIYQERASGADVAAAGDAAFDVTLVDGTTATYIDGAWQASNSDFAWSDAAAQTLLFDRAGLRTIVRYAGPRVERAFLFAVANGMAAQ